LNKNDYKNAGVDIEAGERAVKAIKRMVSSTYDNNVLSELGSFGGLFQFNKTAYEQPVLVASTDGVGTKLRVAIMAGVYDTVGQDLVNHCVDDILVQGATPLFFLDYIGLGKMKPQRVKQVISGMVTACRENACALIGGEMAEMPGIYRRDDLDLVGTIVGAVEKQNLLPADRVTQGDILLGIPSSGLHTNGYSLARKIVFEIQKLKVDSLVPGLNATVAELLLAVHISYLPMLRPFLGDHRLHGLAHITGGGIPGNLKRIIPEGLCAYVSHPQSEFPALYQWLQEAGSLSVEDMRSAFNLGIGLIAVIGEELAEDMLKAVSGKVLGYVGRGDASRGRVRFV
jgi:phosphoribosylformylglycinamidine cyclo-ligase